ncbi:MAG TPA: hypothetical protein VI911_00845 [Patescibacteria group bacterium]|nr:hypothetical protein [Patescibacteria group bacterium]
MAKIVSKTLRFPGSSSADVTGYKLYFVDATMELTYDSPSIDLGMAMEVDLSTIATGKEGVFNLGVTAYDGGGNESDMSVATAVPLDFIAPNAPGVLEIVQVG